MNGFIKSIALSFIMLMAASVSFSQGLGSLNFINELGTKSTATVDDATRLFLLTIEKVPGTFENNIKTLTQLKLIDGSDYSKDNPVRRGLVALMVARHFKLGDSLLFAILNNKRYAFKACAAAGIMQYNQSEWDKLSGDELIEIMGNAGNVIGEDQ